VPVDTAAPTSEIGQVNQPAANFTGGGNSASWAVYIDDRDYAPKMNWPARFEPTERMLTDSQIEGVTLGVSLPVRRLRWFIDPQDAQGAVVERLAQDLGLPVKGQKDFKRGRRRGRFSHDKHLTDALRAPLGHGFYFFEQKGEVVEEEGREFWRLRKLAPRAPRTMVNGRINVAPDGGLVNIVQGIGRSPKPIPVNRLVAYVWDQEAGSWTGRSMLRGCYRPWLAKDTVFKQSPLIFERNGMGVPIIEAPPGATKDELDALSAMARAFRAGERSGGAIPAGTKLTLKGVEGTLPDGPAFMRFCNEEMAKGFLAMFMQLGTTETGSRSLGTVLLDYFSYCIEAIADWYLDVFSSHVIEDWVDWNYGADEEAPALGYERVQDEELDVADLVSLVDKGIIQVDPELESDLRRRYKLPAAPEPVEEPASQAPPVEPEPVEARAGKARRVAASAADLKLPDRELRRQPYSQEVQAKVDYELMDAQVQGQIDSLVAKVKAKQADQVDELAAAIEAADGDLEKLAAIDASPVFADTLEEAMHTMAAQGVEQAMGEAERQGIAPKAPDLDTSSLTSRVSAIDTLLSRSLSEAAGRKATSLTGGSLTPAEVASQVKDYLLGLSDAYLQEQLSGATVQAMNTGRKAVFQENPPKYLYASELLDENACEECTAIDGTEYESLEEAEADYPTGGYSNCEGGPRCRGTLVAVHTDEAEPSQ
jgi:hypothetical protein